MSLTAISLSELVILLPSLLMNAVSIERNSGTDLKGFIQLKLDLHFGCPSRPEALACMVLDQQCEPSNQSCQTVAPFSLTILTSEAELPVVERN